MATEHLIYLSIPGLRPRDVSDVSLAPTLDGWASSGASAELAPSFPCITSPVQASTWTGASPGVHGVIANGFYHRDRRAVEFWVGRNEVVGGRQIWDVLASTGRKSAVWHAQNIKDASATYIVTPAPIHKADGTTELWCYSKPEGLYRDLLDDLGHFPLQHYWGPLANIESSKWILAGAKWLIERYDPDFHYIYLPHLDYAAQKFGPDSSEASQAVRELDALLGEFDAFLRQRPMGATVVFLVASEYAMTDVTGVVYPNIELRRAGLLQTCDSDAGAVIDFAASKAFAMVDHQCAHVYAAADAIEPVASLFRGMTGVDGVYAGDDRGSIGLNHPHAGEVVLSSRPDHWFAYYWWEDEADAPAFARTVDIHSKPGYDAVELFFDPATRSIPLNADLVRGSHGAPARDASQRGGLICSARTPHVTDGTVYRDTDMKSIVCGLMGLDPA